MVQVDDYEAVILNDVEIVKKRPAINNKIIRKIHLTSNGSPYAIFPKAWVSDMLADKNKCLKGSKVRMGYFKYKHTGAKVIMIDIGCV